MMRRGGPAARRSESDQMSTPARFALSEGGLAMDVIHERCCGLDIHKKLIVACTIVPGPGRRPQKAVRSFATMTDDLQHLGQWLTEQGVTHVAMESTGRYWKHVVRHEALFDREDQRRTVASWRSRPVGAPDRPRAARRAGHGDQSAGPSWTAEGVDICALHLSGWRTSATSRCSCAYLSIARATWCTAKLAARPSTWVSSVGCAFAARPASRELCAHGWPAIRNSRHEATSIHTKP
jgi:hypothetical protein